ncbi:MAG: hypothetical protein WCI41_01845 [bacterium]
MKNIKKLLIFAFIFSILILPVFSFAQTTEKSILIPCGTERYPDNTYKDKTTGALSTTKQDNNTDVSKQVSNPCGFDDLLIMINKVIHYVLFVLVVPISAILFAYAGFMIVSSAGNVEKKKKAMSVFWNVGLGLIIAVASWLIISTLLSIIGYDGSWIGF